MIDWTYEYSLEREELDLIFEICTVCLDVPVKDDRATVETHANYTFGNSPVSYRSLDSGLEVSMNLRD